MGRIATTAATVMILLGAGIGGAMAQETDNRPPMQRKSVDDDAQRGKAALYSYDESGPISQRREALYQRGMISTPSER